MKLQQSSIWQRQNWLYLAFGLTLALSGCVILGWLANISSLVQIDENSVPMQFNTALCLFGISLAGITLYKKYYRLTVIMSMVTLFIALLTATQYIFAINLFIDELFITHHITTHTSSPGRMAPNTALCFILSSICLLWLSIKATRSRGINIISGILSLILVLSLLSVLGYVFSIETSYGWGNMTYMSFQTAIGFLLFSIGLLLNIAFHRHAQNASVYYIPIILGCIFLMVTLLFTNDLNNQNKLAQDPILLLKQDLVTDHINLKWNNELLRFATQLPRFTKSMTLNTEEFLLPKAVLAVYLENIEKQTSLVYQQPKSARMPLKLADYTFYPAPNNPIANALGVETTELFLHENRKNLLVKLPLSPSLFTVKQEVASLIIRVDIQLFLQETLSSVLSAQDQIILTSDKSSAAIRLPFQLKDNHLTIGYAVSEFGQSKNRIVYIVFYFGLCITLAIVVTTFFGQRSAYQTKRLIKQAKDKEIHEAQLQQSNLTLTLASEVAKLGIWRWDVATDELSWNDRMYQIYNTPEEVMQSGLLFDYWYQSVHEDDRDRAANSLREAVEHNNVWEEEFKLNLPGGIIKHIKATAICYKNNTTQTTLVFGGNLDITHERELQHQLEEKSKQAELDSLAKSQFLANMSHELRTPMNGVLGIGELLKTTSLTAKQTQYLDTMLSSADKLLSLLNDILDLSKIEAGEMQLEILCVPFEEVVADCLKSLATSAHEKGLDYHYHKDQSVPEWVYTDPVRLDQIIINIVSNAIKFTEKGEITVNIGIDTGKPSKHDAVMVSFEVCDTGIGLTTDEINTIFAPFSQADQSITRRYGGTGLGLSIVQQLIDLFEGSIEITSKPGKGTIVHFSIPMKLGIPEQAGGKSNADYDFYQKHAPVALGEVNCLVVDGNEINRKWLDEMLHSWQCNVTLCADANEGITAWQQSLRTGRLFDVLIIDRNVKGLEAFEFIRTIQKQSSQNGIECPATVFVMTTKNLEADLITCAALNINQHLIKPIKQSEVFNALMSALGKKQASQVNHQAIATVDAGRELNVLVAEDHLVNQLLVKDLLENRGHKIRIVENGRLAIEALESEQFDAILMDVQMPIMDGITATKLIRQGTHQADICIIGLTAKALKGDKNICLDAGMNYYMTKPIKPQALLKILENKDFYAAKKMPIELTAEQQAQKLEALPDYQVFNFERSMITTGEDISLLRKILQLTSESIEPSVEQIKTLHRQRDWPMFGRAVHKCKGMLANFCDSEFMAQMEQLIELAEQGNEQAVGPLIKDVIQKIEQFSDELTDFMKKST